MAQLLTCGIFTHSTFNGNLPFLDAILEPQLARVIMVAVYKSAQSVGFDVRMTISTLDRHRSCFQPDNFKEDK